MTGTIFLYIYNIGTVHTVHVRMRGNYVKRLRDIKNLNELEDLGEAVETAESGRCVYPSAELDINVVRRRERLATETTEALLKYNIFIHDPANT